MTNVDTSHLSKEGRSKQLTKGRKRHVGRSKGQVTVRHKGAGAKRVYRFVDFRMEPQVVPFKVIRLEYDPNRTCWIALVQAEGLEQSYVMALDGMQPGDTFVSTHDRVDPARGNRIPMQFIPEGMEICALEFQPGKGVQVVKSAGSAAVILSKEDKNVQVRLPSGEIRLFQGTCRATIGRVSNIDHGNQRIGTAGRMRRMGVRPTVRGKVMNPVDHPHGGGEARNPIGLTHPKTPWGKHALGVPTRDKKKPSNRWIVRRRPKNR